MIRAVFGTLTRSRRLARCLFGLDLPELPEGAHYFDVTTLALLRAARRRIPAGARVLDMGTGSFALLGLSSWARGCDVVVTEIDPRIAAQAETCIARQGAPIHVLRTSLFEGVEGNYDFVLFNPPYVPDGAGADRGRTEAYRTQWDGGPEGTKTIAAFLDALSARADAATVLMGVNRRHVPRQRIEALFRERPALHLAEVDERGLLPVDVYVFSSTKSPMARMSSPEE